MQRTKIEWTDYSWNPIQGICPVGCFYCYGRRVYQRFKKDPTIRPAEEYPNVVVMPLLDRKWKTISRKVFVCSTFELFHPSVKKEWRDWIFDSIKYNYHLTFQILTKFPQNIDRPMPDNVWLGVTITKDEDIWRRNRLVTTDAKIKFISFEPLLGKIDMKYGLLQRIHWVIIGRLTGYGNKYNPTKRQLSKMRWDIRGNSLGCSPPIFLKDNLKEIWGEPLIQEMPK